MATGHVLQGARERGAVVPEDAEIADLAAETRQHRHQHEAVGIEQLRRSARFARRCQFVAGGEHRDAKAPDDIELCQAEGCRERNVLRPQPLAGLQRRKARWNIFARGPHVGAGLEACGKHDLVAFDADVFLHEHGIGALGHRRAGEDAHRLPRLERLRRGAARLNAADHRKCLFFLLRQVAARNRITVDGGIGEGRQRQRRQNIVRENAAIGASERHRLDIDDRRHARRNETHGLIDRHHRPAEGKAIVGQLRHGLISPQLRISPARPRARSPI